jgi:hypothetical protein
MLSEERNMKMASEQKVERSLRRAQANAALVRVERADIEDGHMDGRVLGVGRGIVVLHLIDDNVLANGFVVLRTVDITSLRVPAPYATFVEHVLRRRGGEQALPARLPAPLSFESIVDYVQGYWHLVSLFTERSKPDVFNVGQVIGSLDEQRRVSLRPVGPDGRWSRKKPISIAMDEISRIDFGGLYEEALAIALGLALKKARAARKTSKPTSAR